MVSPADESDQDDSFKTNCTDTSTVSSVSGVNIESKGTTAALVVFYTCKDSEKIYFKAVSAPYESPTSDG
jgi:hypothetical protein